MKITRFPDGALSLRFPQGLDTIEITLPAPCVRELRDALDLSAITAPTPDTGTPTFTVPLPTVAALLNGSYVSPSPCPDATPNITSTTEDVVDLPDNHPAHPSSPPLPSIPELRTALHRLFQATVQLDPRGLPDVRRADGSFTGCRGDTAIGLTYALHLIASESVLALEEQLITTLHTTPPTTHPSF